MIYNEKIYYKKINDYSEYKVVKNRWEEIIDMQEEDFKNNFMIITAIENTSMQGLIVDKIEVDNDALYISLIREDAENIEFEKYKSGRGDFSEEQIKEFKELDKKYERTCICYLIPRTMEKENKMVINNKNDLINIENIYQDIRNKIITAREKMFKHIDSTMTEVYWYVGKITYELSENSTKAGYGKKVVDALSIKLTDEFGSGFSAVSIRRMRRFYEMYPIWSTVSTEFLGSFSRTN